MKHKTSIKYSASGKVILSGEHAVVFGCPALISAIPLRLVFKIRDGKMLKKDKYIEKISEIVKKYLRKDILFEGDYSYSVTSQIPSKCGLGSSAALSVSSCAAFYEFYSGRQAELDEINSLAFSAEKLFHANPSGADNTICTHGGLVLFQISTKESNSALKLAFKIPKSIEDRLFLLDTGYPEESTKEMVDIVKSKKKSVKKTINDIETVVEKMTLSIKKGDIELFKKSLFDNQKLLEELGVVSAQTKELLLSLSKFGTGKITGAGGLKKGSGFCLFYADYPRKLKLYCKDKGIEIIKFKVSAEGLKRI